MSNLVTEDGISCAIVNEDGTIRDLLVMAKDNLSMPGLLVIPVPEDLRVENSWTYVNGEFKEPVDGY